MAEAKAAAQSEQDMSMEDILQSIRRIIAEDEQDGKAADPAHIGSDVLELTEMVQDDGSTKKTTEAPAPNGNDVLQQIDAAIAPPPAPAPAPVAAAPVPKPAPAPAPVAAQPEPTTAVTLPDDALLSEQAANAAANTLKKLVTNDAPLHLSPSAPFRNGNTVEELVIESLKPMIKDWLDKNLPQIVERLVEKEIRRLTS